MSVRQATASVTLGCFSCEVLLPLEGFLPAPYRLTYLAGYVSWPLQDGTDSSLSLRAIPRAFGHESEGFAGLPGDRTLFPVAQLPLRIWSPLQHAILVPRRLEGESLIVQAVAAWRAHGPEAPPPAGLLPVLDSLAFSPSGRKDNRIQFPWGDVWGTLPAGWPAPDTGLALSLATDAVTVALSCDVGLEHDPRRLAAFEADASLAARVWAIGPDAVSDGWQVRYRTTDVPQKWGAVCFLARADMLVTLRAEGHAAAAADAAIETLRPRLETLANPLRYEVSVQQNSDHPTTSAPTYISDWDQQVHP